MPSKRRSSTSSQKPLEQDPVVFVDRCLGGRTMPGILRSAKLQIIAHDEIYPQQERDPWIFYDAGKNGRIVLTSDREFMKHFAHMAAISLGRTNVVTFTGGSNHNTHLRAKWFLKAKAGVFRLVKKSRVPLIISIGSNGDSKVIVENPSPIGRAKPDQKDVQSYRRVCAAEGVPFPDATFEPLAGA